MVALSDGVVVGQCEAVIHLHPDKPAHLYIEEVAVSPASRRLGIARAMLETMFAEGRRRGCAEVWVLRETADQAARRLYESLGLPGRDHVIHEGERL